MDDPWLIAPFDRPLGVAWEQEGDEWLRHIGDALGEVAGASGWEAGGNPFQVTPRQPGRLSSSLRFEVQDDETWILIAGVGGDPQLEVSTWREVIELANERVGASHEDFEWSALIGPAVGANYNVALPPGEVSCGPLRMAPIEDPIWEHRSANSLTWAYEYRPVEVRGMARAHEWLVASHHARGEVHQACALLSIARDVLWEIKHGPYLSSDSPVLPPPWDEETYPRSSALLAGALRTEPLPDWFAGSWSHLKELPVVRDAVAVHYEGLRLESEHPSFAAIAFVSAIETVGQLRGAVGSRARFCAAVEMVTDAAGVKTLLETYDTRSGTAHAGRLYGGEVSGVQIYPMFFGDSGPQTFRWFTVRSIRETSNKVVVQALKGPLPQVEEPAS